MQISQNPFMADFDLLESNSIYIFLHENQKIYHGWYFFSWCMFRTHVRILGRKGRKIVEEGKCYNCRANDKWLITEPQPIDEGRLKFANVVNMGSDGMLMYYILNSSFKRHFFLESTLLCRNVWPFQKGERDIDCTVNAEGVCLERKKVWTNSD